MEIMCYKLSIGYDPNVECTLQIYTPHFYEN